MPLTSLSDRPVVGKERLVPGRLSPATAHARNRPLLKLLPRLQLTLWGAGAPTSARKDARLFLQSPLGGGRPHPVPARGRCSGTPRPAVDRQRPGQARCLLAPRGRRGTGAPGSRAHPPGPQSRTDLRGVCLFIFLNFSDALDTKLTIIEHFRGKSHF